jgi:hypothetical protein
MQDYERVKDLVNALGLTPRSFAENVDARFTIFAVHSPQESVSEMVRVSVCVFVCSLFSLTDLLTHPHTIPTFTHLHTPQALSSPAADFYKVLVSAGDGANSAMDVDGEEREPEVDLERIKQVRVVQCSVVCIV